MKVKILEKLQNYFTQLKFFNNNFKCKKQQ